MNSILACVLVMLACASGRPGIRKSDGGDASIVNYESSSGASNGAYNFQYESSDGSKRQESGELSGKPGDEDAAVVVKGSYEYLGPDGVLYKVEYVADENGFRPVGTHIPKYYVEAPRPPARAYGIPARAYGAPVTTYGAYGAPRRTLYG